MGEKIEIIVEMENGEFIVKSKQNKKALSKTTQELNKAGKSAKKTGGIFSKMFSDMKGFALGFVGFAAVTKGLQAATKAASNLEEETNKFKVVFKGSMDIANKGVEDLRKNFAMSEREAKQLSGGMQAFLKPMGVAPEMAANLSIELTKLAADMGSLRNADTATVMQEMQSAFAGSSETMIKYGADLKVTAVQQEALRLGLIKQGQALDNASRIQASYSIILKATKADQGDMARSADSYANVLKKTNAQMEDFAAAVGKEMLPAVSDLMTSFSDGKDGAQEFGSEIGKLVSVLIKIAKYAILAGKAITEMSGIGLALKSAKGEKSAIQKIADEMLGAEDATKKAAKAATDYGAALKKLQKSKGVTKKRGGRGGGGGGTKDEGVGGIFGDRPTIGKGAEEVAPIKWFWEADSLGEGIQLFQTQQDALLSIANDTAARMNEIQEMQHQADIKRMEKRYDFARAYIMANVEDEEEKAAALSNLETMQEMQTKMMERRAAKRQKQLKIMEAITSTLSGAAGAFATTAGTIPAPWGLIIGGIAAASVLGFGGALISQISSTPLPSFATGVFDVPGNTMANIHKGETILTKPITESIKQGELTIGGPGVTGGGSEMTRITTVLNVDGRELTRIVDDHRTEKARSMGVTNYGEEGVY